MILTAGQTTAFFENANQMALPHVSVLQLQNEDVLDVVDLEDFDKDTLSQVADNMRRPGGRVPDPASGTAANRTIPTPPFVFGAKAQMRLNVVIGILLAGSDGSVKYSLATCGYIIVPKAKPKWIRVHGYVLGTPSLFTSL